MASIVYVKNKKTGTTYVYENISHWNKETKTTQHSRKCIGQLDPETGLVVPNHKKNSHKASLSSQSQECTVMGSGISLLLDHLSEEMGLTKTLKSVFTEDWQQILTCAYFLVSEGGALCHVEKWSETNLSPCENTLTSQRISELLVRMTRGMQQDFFQRWIALHQQDEYYALDITSVSSYSNLIEFVRYGYNRDGEKLRQINMLMIVGEKSHMPLYFSLIPGSIKDVSTLQETLQTLDFIDVGRIHLVMDKGFYSKENVDALYNAHSKFMMGVPFTVKSAKEQVIKAREDDILSHENYRMIFEDDIFVKSSLQKWGDHRCYMHVYYDSLKAELENHKFNHTLYICYEELVSGKSCKSHAEYYKNYFTVKETPKRGKKVQYNQAAIDEHRKNTTGWFVMLTNDVKEPVEALEIYRRKDAVEKGFDNLKNDLDCKRLRIHSAAAMDGRLFIQYVALILSARIQLTMNEAGWFKNHDMQEVIDEMKSIRQVHMQGSSKKLTTTLTNFQSEIMELFKLSV